MEDIDLLNERIKHITPTADTLNGGVMYACIEFEDGTRRDITFEKFEKLAQKNIDFGGGLERIAAASIDSADVFQIDVLAPLISMLPTNMSIQPHSCSEVKIELDSSFKRESSGSE